MSLIKLIRRPEICLLKAQKGQTANLEVFIQYFHHMEAIFHIYKSQSITIQLIEKSNLKKKVIWGLNPQGHVSKQNASRFCCNILYLYVYYVLLGGSEHHSFVLTCSFYLLRHISGHEKTQDHICYALTL